MGKYTKTLNISGQEVLNLVEGGKGISVSNGQSAGAWAGAGGVGTFSAVNADAYDENGNFIPVVYHGKTRRERHQELIAYAIKGGINQARIAHEMRNGQGRIHMNVLWEMGGVKPVLEGVLSGAAGLVHGVTCGAGMPYDVGYICAQHKVYYYPIVSSGRAFRVLWKRAFYKTAEWLGGVVYEDPWRAGGHNGLSNSENPLEPEDPYPRVAALRAIMNEFNLEHVPIIMAGGVWCLREWEHWLDQPEIGPIAFQFGTRPLLTQESPISDSWKRKLLTLKPNDVILNQFSPTGFYSSAVRNDFMKELEERSARQISYAEEANEVLNTPLEIGPKGKHVFVAPASYSQAQQWQAQGFTETMRTPQSTLVFVTQERKNQIRIDQIECMGCLSRCNFSNWSQEGDGSTGLKPDPRSFCIQKTLQNIAHGADVENQLMFAGHNAYRFALDPFYKDGFIPTVRQLVERLQTGD